MGIVPTLVLAALTLSGLGLALFVWAVGDGQLDDLDEGAWLPLKEPDAAPPAHPSVEPPESEEP